MLRIAAIKKAVSRSTRFSLAQFTAAISIALGPALPAYGQSILESVTGSVISSGGSLSDIIDQIPDLSGASDTGISIVSSTNSIFNQSFHVDLDPSIYINRIDAVDLSENCIGFFSHVPDIVLDYAYYSTESLQFTLSAEREAVLLIEGPGGARYCSYAGPPDAGTVLTIDQPDPGLYSVFVGTQSVPFVGLSAVVTAGTAHRLASLRAAGVGGQMTDAGLDIVETARAADSFNTLVAGVSVRPSISRRAVTNSIVDSGGLLVAREFLYEDEDVNEEFEFVGFLLFPNQTTASLPQRRAAARAFVCQLSSLESVFSDLLGYGAFAVFYAPLRGVRPPAGLIATDNLAEHMLDNYDYETAERYSAYFGVSPDGVHLVGFVAERWSEQESGPQVLHLDLSNESAEEIERAIVAIEGHFRAATLSAVLSQTTIANGQEDGRVAPLDVALLVFDSLGTLISTASAEETAASPPAAGTSDASLTGGGIRTPTECPVM